MYQSGFLFWNITIKRFQVCIVTNFTFPIRIYGSSHYFERQKRKEISVLNNIQRCAFLY